MKRFFPYLLMLIFSSVLAVIACRVAPTERPEWTTESDSALAAFEEGLEARSKFYNMQAHEHFQRALEHDPDFVIAKVMALSFKGLLEDRGEAYREDLENVDYAALTDREVLLVKMAIRDYKDDADFMQMVDEFLESHPDDPYALDLKCRALAQVAPKEAKACDEQLAEAHPNWVSAINRLGYTAMALGEFKEAEERFRTYRFIAPDQANPHDSLGELLILTGRYQEARDEFNAALEVHPEFCASYEHLVLLSIVEGDLEAADEVLKRAEEGCEMGTFAMKCDVRFHRLLNEGQYSSIADEKGDSCYRHRTNIKLMVHRAGLLSGRWEVSQSVEDEVEAICKKYDLKSSDEYRVLLTKLQGDQLIAKGDIAGLDHLATVDRWATYRESDGGTFKLVNQMDMGRSLRDLGFTEESKKVFKRVADINEPFFVALEAGYYPSPSSVLTGVSDIPGR